MIRSNFSAGLVLAGALLAGGCGSNQFYDPKANDSQLSSYAARQTFPQVDAQRLPDVIYNVGDNGVITIYNASNTVLPECKVWVNGQFVIDLKDGLSAHSSIMLQPEKLYNNIGANMTTIKPDSISQVQVFTDGRLYNLAGPVKPMP